jgi:iron complex transport system ATP-binding protein
MNAPAKSSVIEIINLSCGYGSHVVFQGLDLQIRTGELVCFMGPNGVGKSTLIRTIGGLLTPLSGTILFNGPTLLKEQLISLVLTDPIRASYLTVYDLVVFGRYPYLDWKLHLTDADKGLVERAIDLVHIRHLRDRTINELSDGQKQMAMIARALAQDTPVVILDEPTAHLDLNNRVEVMRLLKDLTRTLNKAILLATHELDLALQTADVIWLAGEHRNMTTGIPEDLVLQGVFDEVFKFKGFDLKTGKVQHPIFRKTVVRLTGDGHAYLWTRNLLERNGFAVAESGEIEIVIGSEEGKYRWIIVGSRSFQNLIDLLYWLKTKDEQP